MHFEWHSGNFRRLFKNSSTQALEPILVNVSGPMSYLGMQCGGLKFIILTGHSCQSTAYSEPPGPCVAAASTRWRHTCLSLSPLEHACTQTLYPPPPLLRPDLLLLPSLHWGLLPWNEKQVIISYLNWKNYTKIGRTIPKLIKLL